MGYLAGIDLGTSSTKVLIQAPDGWVMGKGSAAYDISIPSMSYAEQDPFVWWEAVKKALGLALAEAHIQASQIEGIGFSGQMHGVVALDEAGLPICPAIIHLDQRSGPLLGEIRDLAGNLLQEELCNQPSAGMMISTLYWMARTRPEILAKIRTVLSPKDYIRFRLCGELGTDVTDASASLCFSVKHRCWCQPLFDRLGIPGDIFPPVHESYEIAGHISKAASRETGLSEEAKVVYGCGDSLAALTGIGLVRPGLIACNIGTASQLAAVAESPVFDRAFRIQTWCHTCPGEWAIQSGTLNGGSTLSWLRNKILKTDLPFSSLDEEALAVDAGSEGLLFLPYLAGERTPWNDPDAKGVYFGLGMKHTRGHLVRATMEGVLFNLRECMGILDELSIGKAMLLASGGAAKGRTWKQIEADMMNMPVHTTTVEEEACQGAIILALVGLGIYPDIPTACQSTISLSEEVTYPVPEHVKLYEERQAIFRDLYLKTKDTFSLLKA